jgi:hypothetical protein
MGKKAEIKNGRRNIGWWAGQEFFVASYFIPRRIKIFGRISD